MSKKSFGPSTILVIIGLLFIAAVGFRTISTPEIWTHLAQGRTNAPISYLSFDSAVNTTWLYDKLAYTAWNIGGANLLILLNITGLLAAFILLMQVAKKWGGELSQGFALLIAGHLMFQTMDVGPQVVMILFLALFIYVLNTSSKTAVLFGALIPLQIVWTNMHGSFLYGPLLAGLAALQVAQQSKGPAGRSKKGPAIPSATYGMLAILLLIATVANPSFFELHAQVLANLKSPAPSYWSSLFIEYFQIPALKPLILFVMVLGAGGLITLKKKLPIMLTTLAIYGAFLVWTSPQMAILFAVLSFPFVVLSLKAISEYIRGSLEHVLGSQAKLLVPATSVVFVLLVALSLIPIVSNCAYAKTASASNFGLGIQEELYPANIETLINDPAFPAAEKTINLAADGGYLAFKYNRKVFIDYRPGRYEKDLLIELNDMLLGSKEAYDSITDEFRPEAFIINTLSPSAAQGIVTLLAQRIWKLAYFDGTTAILILNKESFAPVLNNKQAQEAGLARLEKARADYAAKSGSCSAGNPAELIGSGKVFLALNRPQEAEAIFTLLLQSNKNIPGAWIGLGNSQLLMKNFDGAIDSLKAATKVSPNSIQAWISYANAYQMKAKYTEDAVQRAELRNEAQMAVDEAKEIAERSRKDLPEETAPVPEIEVEIEVPEQSLEDIMVPIN
jgi:tetratricopeptide (TPR) repeat protein